MYTIKSDRFVYLRTGHTICYQRLKKIEVKGIKRDTSSLFILVKRRKSALK